MFCAGRGAAASSSNPLGGHCDGRWSMGWHPGTSSRRLVGGGWGQGAGAWWPPPWRGLRPGRLWAAVQLSVCWDLSVYGCRWPRLQSNQSGWSMPPQFPFIYRTNMAGTEPFGLSQRGNGQAIRFQPCLAVAIRYTSGVPRPEPCRLHLLIIG